MSACVDDHQQGRCECNIRQASDKHTAVCSDLSVRPRQTESTLLMTPPECSARVPRSSASQQGAGVPSRFRPVSHPLEPVYTVTSRMSWPASPWPLVCRRATATCPESGLICDRVPGSALNLVDGRLRRGQRARHDGCCECVRHQSRWWPGARVGARLSDMTTD